MKKKLKKGAQQTIQTCLAVKSHEKVFIFGSQSSQNIAEVLFQESQQIAKETHWVTLEDFGKRPFKKFPKKLAKELQEINPEVTIYTAEEQDGEMPFRHELLGKWVAKEIKSRHGHMLGIDEKVMAQGVTADPYRLKRDGDKLLNKLKKAKNITITAKNGTALSVTLDSNKYQWFNDCGLIHQPGFFANIPGGEIMTYPENVEGILVSSILGDYFMRKYGQLTKPVEFTVQSSRVIDVSHPNKRLSRELEHYFRTDKNSDRAGEFAFGTNYKVKEVNGNFLQDEKVPGIHIAFGSPYPEYTGANWDSTTHIDLVLRHCDAWLEDKQIMKNDRYLI